MIYTTGNEKPKFTGLNRKGLFGSATGAPGVRMKNNSIHTIWINKKVEHIVKERYPPVNGNTTSKPVCLCFKKGQQ